MKINLKLSRIGMNMEEATIIKWHKQPGDTFREGDTLYEFETEKVTEEFTATGPGRLLEIRVPEGEDAKVGEIVAVVETES